MSESNGRPKTVLITGCSAGGIGDALAQNFHRKGLRVFATARDLAKVQHLKEMGMAVLRLDVVDTESIQKALAQVSETTGGLLDILVNNSGIGYSTPAIEVDMDQVRKVFEVNLFARFVVTKAFTPLLMQAKGTILNIGSIAGMNPSPWKATDNACAAAMINWNDTLRIELEPFDVQVILVITGAISTNFIKNLPTTRLKPQSLYSPARDVIEAAMDASSLQKNFVDVEGYAEQVVNNVLSRAPRKRQWAGGVANQIWLASTFLWSTAWDWLLATPFGITELKRKLAEEKPKAK